MEEHTTTLYGQVVLRPVPQLTQVLVVQGIEGVKTERDRGLTNKTNKQNVDYTVFLLFKCIWPEKREKRTYSVSRWSPLMMCSLRRKERETSA